MGISLKNKIHPLFAFCLLLSAAVFTTSCKSANAEEIFFEKIVHPREYFFDIYEVDDYPKLKKDKNTGIMRFTIDFTDFVKYDLPQAGDSLIFKYKCKSNKDLPGAIYAYLSIPGIEEPEKVIFATDLKKKQFFDNQITFVIPQNLENVELVVEYYEPIKYSTIYFTFEEVIKTTDTKKEKKELEKAIKKGYTIIDKNTGLPEGEETATETVPASTEISEENDTISDDENNAENEVQDIAESSGQETTTEEQTAVQQEENNTELEESPAEIQEQDNAETVQEEKDLQTSEPLAEELQEETKTPQQLIEEEKSKLLAEQKRLKEERAKLESEKAEFEAAAKAKKESDMERERIEQEHLKQQKKLEETMEAVTNTNVQRYEKEYLNDYAVSGYTFDMEKKDKKPAQLFSNPDKADDFGVTLLMEAAKEGNDWKIEALINAGADVNKKDKDGWTALMYAVRYHGNMDCVELLINAGADIKAQNNYGTSALILASNYNSNPEILKKLLSYYSPNEKDVLKSFIQVLTENQDDEYIQLIKVNLFLDLSVPLNSLFNGKTPLMYAAESGRSTKVIEMLLENSNTAIRSREGKTAFDYAKENPKLKHDDIYWSLNNK